jgi:hypothetical protein
MNSRKLLSLILGVFTATVALTLSVPSTNQYQQPNGASIQPQVADGSGPVPPLPPQVVLLADGSGPVPPLPPKALPTFLQLR